MGSYVVIAEMLMCLPSSPLRGWLCWWEEANASATQFCALVRSRSWRGYLVFRCGMKFSALLEKFQTQRGGAILNFFNLWAPTPSTAGTFRKKFRKNSEKTPETLSERFLEFPLRVRLGCPKPL